MKPETFRLLLFATCLIWGALAVALHGPIYPAMAAWLFYLHASATRKT